MGREESSHHTFRNIGNISASLSSIGSSTRHPHGFLSEGMATGGGGIGGEWERNRDRDRGQPPTSGLEVATDRFNRELARSEEKSCLPDCDFGFDVAASGGNSGRRVSFGPTARLSFSSMGGGLALNLDTPASADYRDGRGRGGGGEGEAALGISSSSGGGGDLFCEDQSQFSTDSSSGSNPVKLMRMHNRLDLDSDLLGSVNMTAAEYDRSGLCPSPTVRL